MNTETFFLSADFSSFDDFSSRMVLLPRRDDECTGAKVGSHEVEVPTDIIITGGGSSAQEQQIPVEEGLSSMEDVDLDNAANSDGSALKENGSCSEQPDMSANSEEIEGIELSKKAIAANVIHSLPLSWRSQTKDEHNQTQLLRKTAVAIAVQAISQFVSDEQDSGNVEQPDRRKSGQKTAMQVPIGYVLVGMRNLNDSTFYDSDTKDMPEDFESIEFVKLLSVLREASFPLSLVFAPPNDSPTSHESFFAGNENAKSKAAASPTDSSTADLSDEDVSIRMETNDSSQSLPIVSREDAAKYAKEAATVFGGRLSRWGYQAAARAVDAASQVKELRDERQRKIKDEQQYRDDHNEDGDRDSQSEVVADCAQSFLPTEPEHEDLTEIGKTQPRGLSAKAVVAPTENTQPENFSSESMAAGKKIPQDLFSRKKEQNDPEEPCSIFLQTRKGFKKLPDDTKCDPHALPHITNDSVVSVRLSEERACPLGKKGGGYIFQWYRSNSENGLLNGSSLEDYNNWSLLRGANYAAYQPSVFDAGHQLCCVIKHGTDGNISHQACHLPCLVAMDPSLFNSSKMTLLGGKKSVIFGNLRNMADLTIFRLKIEVSSRDDFISSSSIFIDKVGGSKDEINEMAPVSHFEAVADPAKPRLFDLICSPHGRLRLEAANRKSRESLLLALGIASFKGKLSSLTPETNLFPSYATEAELHPDSNSTPPGPIDISDLGPDDTSTSPCNSISNQHLEAKLAEMHHLLQSKDSAIAKLQQELVRVGKKLDSCQSTERQNNSELERYGTALAEKTRKIEDLTTDESNAKMAHERTVKALMNEKAVLQAAVKARDGKIEGLKIHVSQLEISHFEHRTSAEKAITKKEEVEVELQRDLNNAKETIRDLNCKFLASKETVSKRESDCRKLRIERNNLKNRADGLSKEMKMLRISKSAEDALEIEKLKAEIQRLVQENADLQEHVEVTKLEKRDALGRLEATCMAHQQSVMNYQISTDKGSGVRVSEQRVGELESVVSSMTEYLNAKEMQIETLKQVNQVLVEDMNELTRE